MLGYLAWSVKTTGISNLRSSAMNSGVQKLSWRTSMTWRSAWPIEFVRQQFEKAAEVGGVEFFGRRELPEQGAEMIAEFGDAGIEEALDGVARLLEHAPVDGKARTLEREHEAGRHLARPFAERRRRLRAVERAVDLDRGQPLAGIGQFLARAAGPSDKTRRATARRSSRRCRCRFGRCAVVPISESCRCH